MFKYSAHDPDSALSIVAAALRLYFDSFFYTLTLSVVATLTFFSLYYISVTYFPVPDKAIASVLNIVPALISLIFFIPLIKRIYSVGADLPITTSQAFSGFFVHYFRMAIFVTACIVASLVLPVLLMVFNPPIDPNVYFYLIGAIVFIYVYVTLKLYFTALFIILENKPVLEAIKLSFKIESNHMWLTFCVLSLYFLGYWTITSLFSNFIVWETLGIDLIKEGFTIISMPLFLCIQITQFFNLKRLAQQSAIQTSSL